MAVEREIAVPMEGKTVVVTGASSGIGRGIARRFAAEGASVVCADLRREPVPDGAYDEAPDLSTDEVIERHGGRAAFIETDVTVADSVDALVTSAVSFGGRLDVMVNNAGVWHGFRKIANEPESEFDNTMAVNAKGVWLGCRSAVRQMLKQGGGRIVNLGSIAGVVGLRREPAYSASKAAVVNLTRQLASDYGPDRIAVNVVCPGFIDTAMSRQASGQNPEHELTPWPRLGRVSDVVTAVLFLASDAAEWITGAVLAVDGGYTAR